MKIKAVLFQFLILVVYTFGLTIITPIPSESVPVTHTLLKLMPAKKMCCYIFGKLNFLNSHEGQYQVEDITKSSLR